MVLGFPLPPFPPPLEESAERKELESPNQKGWEEERVTSTTKHRGQRDQNPAALPAVMRRKDRRREVSGSGEDEEGQVVERPDRTLLLREQAVMAPNGSMGKAYVYVPFPTADLFNWKAHMRSYSSDPERMAGLLAEIKLSHQPTRGNVMELHVCSTGRDPPHSHDLPYCTWI